MNRLTKTSFSPLNLLGALIMFAIMALMIVPVVLPPARAVEPTLPDSGYTQTVLGGVTLTASMVSTQNVVIDCTGKANLAVQISQTGAAASATNITTYSFDYSCNKSNWVAWKTAAITGNGTTAVNAISNSWSLGGVRFVRLSTVNNAAAGSTPTNTTYVYTTSY